MLGRTNPIVYFIFGSLLTFFMIEIRNKCYIKGDVISFLQTIIEKLVRQSARWSTASAQDESPLIAVLHANYGAGYLWALKDIASDSDIETATGVNAKKLESEIVKVQDDATKKMIRACPEFAPDSTYLTKLGGEGT